MQNTTQQITAQQITNLLQNKASTFANLQFVTQVQTAAKHKNVNITKHTNANVMLFSNSFAYAKAVQKSASKIANNEPEAVQNFTAQQNYFVHKQ